VTWLERFVARRFCPCGPVNPADTPGLAKVKLDGNTDATLRTMAGAALIGCGVWIFAGAVLICLGLRALFF
jgi:hypothetical protein